MGLSLITDTLAGAAKGFILSGGSPQGAFQGAAGASEERRAKQRQQNREKAFKQEMEAYTMAMGSGEFTDTNRLFTSSNTTTGVNSAGFGSTFGTFLTDLGKNIISPLAGIGEQVAPFFTRSAGQQPAVNTTGNRGAQESQQSGSNTAFVLPGLSQLTNVARQFMKTPAGQIGTGTAVGGALSLLSGGEQRTMRVTRKMKSQARMVVNLTGGNLAAASDILGISQDMLIFILLKRFRNDGPVVTKAALRKTKQTVRRLKNMCDMYDSLRPAATRRRASPMKRASTTLISNK